MREEICPHCGDDHRGWGCFCPGAIKEYHDMTPQEQYDKLRNAEAPAAPALPPDIIRVIAAQYRTTDGHLFDSVEGAEAHAKQLRFNAWYADLPDGLYGSGSVGSVDGSDLWDWLVLNKVKVLGFLA